MEYKVNPCCASQCKDATITCEKEVNRFEKEKGHIPVFINDDVDGEPLVSTMKSTYVFPEQEPQEATIGRKKAFLLKQFKSEASEEVIRESEGPLPVEEYCTTYDGTYHIPGFRNENKSYEKRTELHDKYPLYKSSAITFYGWNVEKNSSSVPVGFTKAISKAQPFRRNSNFTKPIEECYESNL